MLVVDDKHTLRALLRALVSAKFSPDPHDRDVPASPLTASVAREAAAALEHLEVQQEGEVAAERWRLWRDLTVERPEWEAALRFAAEAFVERWATWTPEQRGLVIADLVAPYELSTESLGRFLHELEARMANVT